MDEKEIYIRSLETLQGEHRKQFSYIINLFIVLSSGALALAINLLANDSFEEVVGHIYLYCVAILSWAFSFIAGLLTISCYLYNIKLSIAGINIIEERNKEAATIETVQAERKKAFNWLKFFLMLQILTFGIGGFLFMLAIVPWKCVY